jgi:Short C-terminal domain
LLAIVPLGLMAGGPEDHFTDSRELYGLVEGDEWAHVEALDPDAGYWARRFAQLANWRARGEKAVIEPSSASAAELVEQLKEIARLRAEGALTESEFEAVKARLLSDEASA